MSSILTNNSAMVALQTLKSINSDLSKTQSMISTGKEVGSAKDNAAVWAISKVMESDVAGFKAISSSLSLGESTVGVGRNGAETITDLLTEIKGKITGAQEENVDRDKLQTDIEALTAQIESVVGAAQFNGMNLLDGSAKTNVSVLSSINRAADGSVKSASIDVTSSNMSTEAGTVIADGEGYDAVAAAAAITAGDDVDLSGTAMADVTDGSATAAATVGAVAREDIDGVDYSGGLVAGDTMSIKVGDVTSSYRVQVGDTAVDANRGMVAAMTANGIEDFTLDAAGTTLTYSGASDTTHEFAVQRDRGANYGLSQIDVSTEAGANAALSEIEGMIQKAIDSSATFGSAEQRISIQSEFVSKLTDSLKSGIGALVDANMEETSARLQALQVQQQLGVQSLSIANQAPQSILSLFR